LARGSCPGASPDADSTDDDVDVFAMSDDLTDALQRLEAFLASSGAAIVPTLNPGIDSSVVSELLDEWGLRPNRDFAAWFGWHDGSGARDAPRQVAEVVPGGEFYELKYMCERNRELRSVAASLAEPPGEPWYAQQWWRAGWFPLLRLFGKGYLVADLAGGPGTVTPVHVAWSDASLEERARVAWPSIHAFVETMIERFESGEYWVDEAGVVRGDNIDYPNP
jgi:cell wall assembly regulator SMI1